MTNIYEVQEYIPYDVKIFHKLPWKIKPSIKSVEYSVKHVGSQFNEEETTWKKNPVE